MARRWSTQHDDFDENIAGLGRGGVMRTRGLPLQENSEMSFGETIKYEPYSDTADTL